ncbi:hypothetical protein EJD97_021215 [Solanum chilense]|uniref:Rapid ALkalinization Factor n=1 Tax=Solanum chilense TaxID=4083 RepID=A0A6N2AY85_SOLCI|nr:hypothetical protein EJD97_021215 [Solanum chilense]
MERKCYKKMLLIVLVVTITKVQQVTEALDDVHEFLMESQTSTMILAGNARDQHLSFDATGSVGEICKENIKGNCIDNKNLNAQHCTYGSRCKHVVIS